MNFSLTFTDWILDGEILDVLVMPGESFGGKTRKINKPGSKSWLSGAGLSRVAGLK